MMVSAPFADASAGDSHRVAPVATAAETDSGLASYAAAASFEVEALSRQQVVALL